MIKELTSKGNAFCFLSEIFRYSVSKDEIRKNNQKNIETTTNVRSPSKDHAQIWNNQTRIKYFPTTHRKSSVKLLDKQRGTWNMEHATAQVCLLYSSVVLLPLYSVALTHEYDEAARYCVHEVHENCRQ